jgi:hypothetical protein
MDRKNFDIPLPYAGMVHCLKKGCAVMQKRECPYLQPLASFGDVQSNGHHIL